MEWSVQDLGAIGEFISSIAVVLTLIYLAVQTRQTQKMVKAQTRQSWAEATELALMTAADSDYLPVIEQKLYAAGFPHNSAATKELDSVEYSRYHRYLIANTHRIRSHLYQVSIGVCDDVMAPPPGMWEPRLRAFGLEDVAADMERLYDEVGVTKPNELRPERDA
jgi:hypothetical protein